MRGFGNGVCASEFSKLFVGLSFQDIYKPIYNKIISEQDSVRGDNLQMVNFVPRI
jgi:hypothetical protein